MQTLRTVFSELEAPLLDEMEALGAMKQLPAGVTILQSGQEIGHIILIIDGLVKLYRDDDEGAEFFMYHLEPGDGCALSMSAASGKRKSAVTAKTVTETRLLAFPFEMMESWMRKYPSWFRFVVNTFQSRFEELLLTVDHIAFRNMDERLEFYLKRHRDSQNASTLNITHAEIAQELNSSREVITRLLRKLADKGKIILNRSAIEIIDL